MIFNKEKSLITVFALFLFVGFITAGCDQKAKSSWVNTSSMPGNTFSKKVKHSSAQILYMGSEKESRNVDFGPSDVSFDFKTIK